MLTGRQNSSKFMDFASYFKVVRTSFLALFFVIVSLATSAMAQTNQNPNTNTNSGPTPSTQTTKMERQGCSDWGWLGLFGLLGLAGLLRKSNSVRVERNDVNRDVNRNDVNRT